MSLFNLEQVFSLAMLLLYCNVISAKRENTLRRVLLKISSSVPSSTWNIYHRFQDPTESENLANKHPDLVKELLAEAEVVLKDAPMQVGCACVMRG